jgi:Flp pilus assembly protein TadD
MRLNGLKMLTISIIFLIFLVIVQTLSASNLFPKVSNQNNAFAETSANVTSLTEKAVILNSLGRFDEAQSYLDKALSMDPNNVLALINKGISLDGWIDSKTR